MRSLKIQILISILLIVAGLTSLTNTNQYVIEKKSVLFLQGTTNVNTFTCNCKQQFPARPYAVKKNNNHESIEFTNTYLQIPITSFDCGIRKMNTDFQHALNAHLYPNIKLGLLRTETTDDCKEDRSCLTDDNDWAAMKALTEISINGCSKLYWVDVDLRRIGANQLQCKGKRKFKMTDFDVKPPQVLMVKVNDVIEINFDFVVSLR